MRDTTIRLCGIPLTTLIRCQSVQQWIRAAGSLADGKLVTEIVEAELAKEWAAWEPFYIRMSRPVSISNYQK
jgi:hypothetical protein